MADESINISVFSVVSVVVELSIKKTKVAHSYPLRFNDFMTNQKAMTRREFLRLCGAAGMAAALAACQRTLPDAAIAPSPSGTVAPSPSSTHTPTLKPTDQPTETPSPSPTWSPAQLPGAVSAEQAAFLASHEVKQGDTTRPVVLLTYDDNGDSVYIQRLLDTLAATGAKASFFFIGTALKAHAADIQRLVAEGHVLGCHGYSHEVSYPQLSDAELDAEFERYLTEAAEILPGYRLRWWRAPYGSRDQRVRDRAAAWGLQHVMWTRVSDGWSDQAYKIAEVVEPGDIILGHMFRYFDIYQSPQIISRLQERGFSMETLDTGLSADSYIGS